MSTSTSLLSAPAMALAAMLVSLTFSLVFMSAHRRHTQVAGPGWWSVAGLFALFSFAGLGSRFVQGGASSVGLANSTLLMAMLICWLGVRAHLGMTVRMAWVWWFAAVVLVVNGWLFGGWTPPAWRPVFFILVAVGLALASLADLLRHGMQAQHSGIRALTGLSLIELLGLLSIGMDVAGSAAAGHVSMEHAEAGLIMTAFFISALIRMIVYLLLVFQRLQQISMRNEEQLRRRDAQSWEMLESLQVGVVALSERGEVLRANARACQLVDLRPRDGQPDQPLMLSVDGWCDGSGAPLNPEDVPHAQVMHPQIQSVKDLTVGVPVAGSSSRRWLLCNAFALKGGGLGQRQAVLTLIDMTDLRISQERERQLQARHLQAEKMEALGSLASGVAHDFNNVLTAILGHTRLLREGEYSPAEYPQVLSHVERAALKGRSLVKRILAFGRRQGVTREPIDLCELLDDIGNLLQVLRKPGVHLSWQCEQRIPVIVGDATQLSQVLLNLGTNAIHAIGQGTGTVTIRAAGCSIDELIAHRPAGFDPLRHQGPLSPSWVRVVVEDDGCGMDAATQAKAFEPFFTTKPMGEGTGLGLASVKDIVAAHGGFIGLQSQPGHGTRFRIWLPASDAGNSLMGVAASDG
jgi:two-component system, cell cycle sensor histidine kinase and response regulator CckA